MSSSIIIYFTHRSVCKMNAAAAAKSLQSCPTLCDPIDGSSPGSPVPGILQARTLEWVAISFSNAWKWSHSVVSDSSRPHGLQPTRLLHSWDFPGKSTGMGCHCLLHISNLEMVECIKKGVPRLYANTTHCILRTWAPSDLGNCGTAGGGKVS